MIIRIYFRRLAVGCIYHFPVGNKNQRSLVQVEIRAFFAFYRKNRTLQTGDFVTQLSHRKSVNERAQRIYLRGAMNKVLYRSSRFNSPNFLKWLSNHHGQRQLGRRKPFFSQGKNAPFSTAATALEVSKTISSRNYTLLPRYVVSIYYNFYYSFPVRCPRHLKDEPSKME